MDWQNMAEDEKKRLADELLVEAQKIQSTSKISIYKSILKNFQAVIELALNKNSGLKLETCLKMINKKAESTIDRSTFYQFIKENHLRDFDNKVEEQEEKQTEAVAVKKMRKKLSEEEVFNFKEAHPEMTNEEIADHFNVSSRTIRKKLQSFKN